MVKNLKVLIRGLLAPVLGFSLAKDVRKMNTDIPILFLSAKSMTEDKVEGFKSGGDDYLTKPFSIDELQVRVTALLKRINIIIETPEDKVVKIGSYVFDTENFILRHAKFEKTFYRCLEKEIRFIEILNLEKQFDEI